MKGLKLCESYFKEYEDGLKEILKGDYKYVSVGLCGQGSECFGFDDELSADHDFGPGFCIFLGDEMYEKYAEALNKYYDALPKEYMGYERITSAHGDGRVGVIRTEDFYYKNLGIDVGPISNLQWYGLSEERLAMVTNGEIFHEGDDEFMQMRERLSFFPEDVFLKKLSSRFAAISQSGQYNYKRCFVRNDMVSSYFALSLFMQNVISSIYLLRGRYMPFYKWSFFGLKELKDTDNYVRILNALSRSRNGKAEIADNSGETVITRKYDVTLLIDAICGELSKECVKLGLLSEDVSYLEDAVLPLSSRIKDDLIFKLPLETYVRLW